MMVTEFRDRFLQLAHYAPADVARDSDKQEYFKEGLDDHMQYALLNLRFDSFNHLVDAALNTERKRQEIEDKKRKMAPSSSGSNTRPRYQHPQQQQQRPPQQYQQRQQYPPYPQQQAGQGQRPPAPPVHQLRGTECPLLLGSRPLHFLECASTAASRGTTPTSALGRRRQDSRGVQHRPRPQLRAG
jgi:hypothetical protein